MSAYHYQKTCYKDRDCLVEALGEMGYTTVEVHDIAQNLVGYHGDTRSQKANVIVRRVHVGTAANDLGFVKQDDGTYSAIVSSDDSGKHNAQWMTKLKVAYTERVDMKTARKNGLQFLGKKIENGKVRLQFIDNRRG
jgi:Protein of unknown function (DUF1257)